MHHTLVAFCCLMLIPLTSAASNHQSANSLCAKFFSANHYEKAIEACHPSAEQGEKEAQYYLGLMYFQGLGVIPNNTAALKWFNLSARQNYPQAQYYMGKMYSTGLASDGEPSDNLASTWYRKSANQGFAPAQFLLSLSYALGMGVPKDEQAALKWYQLAAEQQYAKARPIPESALSAETKISFTKEHPGNDAFQKGMDLQIIGLEDYATTVEAGQWLLKAAELGHPDAQAHVGLFYKNGIGFAQDYEQAIFWFKQAATQKHKTAQLYLAWMTLHGFGVPSDEFGAVAWFMKAYEDKEKIKALETTPLPSTTTQAIEENNTPTSKTFAWYLEAAKKEDTNAQYEVGIRYLTGQETEKDAFEAIRWLKQAANRSHQDAQYQLAKLYQKGEIVTQSDFDALTYFKLAAKNGHPKAQYDLGLLYFKGQMVPQSFVHAYAWLNVSSANGNNKATTARQALQTKMTQEQIQEAQVLSQEFFKK